MTQVEHLEYENGINVTQYKKACFDGEASSVTHVYISYMSQYISYMSQYTAVAVFMVICTQM